MSRPGALKVFNWLIALCGLWEAGDISALLVPGSGPLPLFLWNHILAGLILATPGSWAALKTPSS